MTRHDGGKFFHTCERGATVVEFAVVAALVLAIVFGILEFGLIFLQEHYVADAAREGARIGVRANNYDCFNGKPNPCTSDRETKVIAAVIEYLDVLYDADDVTVEVSSIDIDTDNPGGEILQVSVKADNFCPSLITGLLKLLQTSRESNVNNPAKIAFITSMEYEDHKEFTKEQSP